MCFELKTILGIVYFLVTIIANNLAQVFISFTSIGGMNTSSRALRVLFLHMFLTILFYFSLQNLLSEILSFSKCKKGCKNSCKDYAGLVLFSKSKSWVIVCNLWARGISSLWYFFVNWVCISQFPCWYCWSMSQLAENCILILVLVLVAFLTKLF